MKEMKNYYEDKSSVKGLIAISNKVFEQIALDVLNDRRKENPSFALEYGKKKGVIKAEISKRNKVTITIGLFLPIGSDAKILNDIQKEVYDEAFEATEIASLKVDVQLLGCYPVK